MVHRAASSLIVCCFLLITIPHFIPQALASRKLADDPRYDDPNPSGNEEDDGRHKIGVGGSTSRRAGSATGNSPPATIQNSPPTPTTKIGYESIGNNRGSSVTTKTSTSGTNSNEARNVTSASGSTVTTRSSSTGDGNSNSTTDIHSASGSSVTINGTTTTIVTADGRTITFSPTGFAISGGPPGQPSYP